jgi:hypothetical protein
MQGRSLRPLLDGGSMAPAEILLEARRGAQVFPTQESWLGLRTGTEKLVMRLDATDRVLERRLYDLAADPREQRSIASAEPERAAALAERLLRLHRDAAAGAGPPPVRPLDQLTSEALRALGYAE